MVRRFTKDITCCSQCPARHELTDGLVTVHWCNKYRQEITFGFGFGPVPQKNIFPEFCKLKEITDAN